MCVCVFWSRCSNFTRRTDNKFVSTFIEGSDALGTSSSIFEVLSRELLQDSRRCPFAVAPVRVRYNLLQRGYRPKSRSDDRPDSRRRHRHNADLNTLLTTVNDPVWRVVNTFLRSMLRERPADRSFAALSESAGVTAGRKTGGTKTPRARKSWMVYHLTLRVEEWFIEAVLVTPGLCCVPFANTRFNMYGPCEVFRERLQHSIQPLFFFV